MARRDWSDRENELIVRDYFSMLLDELHGAPYKKSEHSLALRQKLDGRTKGSVELKHANISSVMQALDLPIVNGYKPYGHSQRSLEEAVVEFLEQSPKVKEDLDRIAMSLPAVTPDSTPGATEVSAPEPGRKPASKRWDHLRPLPRRYDYSERDFRNRQLGRLGEQLALDLEKRRLEREGRADLAEQVEWTADVRGDGFGFDIASFTRDGAPLFVEVKTTNFGLRTPFFITRNEVGFSREEKKRFRLLRLFQFSSDARGFYTLDGAIEEHCRLEPISYQASISA